MLDSKQSNMLFSNLNSLLAANEFILILRYFTIGKWVILLVNINYLQLRVVLTTRRSTIIQMGRWLPWLLDFH